jgi:hypothetical protein
VPVIRQTLTVIKRIAIVIGIAIAFSLGLLGAIYLSLRSSETRVPDIVGKDRIAAENTISDAGLNFRVRAERATSEAKPGTVLIQLPHAGEIVKVGQTVAVDISRPTKDGEYSAPANANANANANAHSSPTKENNAAANNSNANANKRKPRNANANDNQNGNANRSNRNTNRALNGNANSNATGTRTNTNTTPANRAGSNTNANRRPPAVRTPTP